MKIHTRKAGHNEGSVLIVTLSITTILAFLIGSYLCLIRTQYLSVGRAQNWQNAMAVAEAGIEEALAHLNSGVTTNQLATNTWKAISAGVVGKTNFLGKSYYYVTIQTAPAVSTPYPRVISTAYVPGPVSGPTLSRVVQLDTKAKSGGAGAGGAIITSGTITFSGFNVTVDSYDSSNTNYSSNAQYDPNKRLANGDVMSTSSASNSVYVGDSKVYGTVHTDPGVAVGVDVKGGGYSVGDVPWVNSTNGIEPGHALQDASYSMPDATLPNLSWSTPASTKYKLNGIMYSYVLDNSSPWKLSTLNSSVYVNSPNVVLYVSDTFNIGSGMQILLASGASLTIYSGAASTSIGGQGIVNSSGLPANFQYYGLPSNTAFGLQANASFAGLIYAPEAYVTIGGGGSSPYDFSGQIIAQSMKMNGHFNVHYDQHLTNGVQTVSGFAAAAWKEL